MQNTLVCVIMRLRMFEASVEADALSFILARGYCPAPLAQLGPEFLHGCVCKPRWDCFRQRWNTCQPHAFPTLSDSFVPLPLPRRSTRAPCRPRRWSGPSGDWRVNKGNIFHAFLCLMPFPSILWASETEGKVCKHLRTHTLIHSECLFQILLLV